MKHQRIELVKLVASAQPRPLITEAVDKLASSIREVGLIQPITVKPCSMMIGGLAGQGYKIVAGHHRVAACRALGWSEIDALVIDTADHLSAELVEIDENLCRAELTAAQRAQAIKRRREIWEALHPSKNQVEKVFPPEIGYKKPPPQEQGFAASTAAAAGLTKQAINQHLARAEALGDDLPRVAGTSLDKGVELDALAKLPEADRAELIERAQAGEKVSARDATPAAPTPKPVPAAPALTPSMRLQMALVHGINRMLESAGAETVGALVEAIAALPQREIDFMSDQLDELMSIATLGGRVYAKGEDA